MRQPETLDGQQNYRNLAAAIFKLAAHDLSINERQYRRLCQSDEKMAWIKRYRKNSLPTFKRVRKREWTVNRRNEISRIRNKYSADKRRLEMLCKQELAPLDERIEKTSGIERFRLRARRTDTRKRYQRAVNSLRHQYEAELSEITLSRYEPMTQYEIKKHIEAEYERTMEAIETDQREIEMLFDRDTLWSDILGWRPNLKKFKASQQAVSV